MAKLFKSFASQNEIAGDKPIDSIPLRHEIFVTVDQTQVLDNHPIYETKLRVPAVGKEWSVQYKFGMYRDFKTSLDSQLQGYSKSGDIMAVFPRTLRRRSLGIPLSKEQQEERTSGLDQWVKELIKHRTSMPPQAKGSVALFLQLDQLGEQVDNVVLTDSGSHPLQTQLAIKKGQQALLKTNGTAGNGRSLSTQSLGAVDLRRDISGSFPTSTERNTAAGIPVSERSFSFVNSSSLGDSKTKGAKSRRGFASFSSGLSSSSPAAASTNGSSGTGRSHAPMKSIAETETPEGRGHVSMSESSQQVQMLLRTGIPVLQYKSRKSKLGVFTSRPRLLRLSPNFSELQLIAANEGADWAAANRVAIADILRFASGTQASDALAQAFGKKGNDWAVAAEERCLSVVFGNGQWDIELSSDWLSCLDGSDGVSLRNEIFTFLTSLLQKIEFVPAATFTGRRPGFVFKLGERGQGYYADGPSEVAETKLKKKKSKTQKF